MRSLRIKFNGAGECHVVSRGVDRDFKITPEEALASGICVADEDVLIRRCLALYEKDEVEKMRQRWENWRKTGQGYLVNEEMGRLRRRRDDISPFMKILKQRFSMSYNGRHDRKGTLWEGRFWSSLVESEAQPIVSAYVDLDPVRAKI